MTSVSMWLLLRKPFILTPKCMQSHVCEWERIDVDHSGCLLCSTIHSCGYGKCKQVTQTTDALVCDISGLCIRTDNISDKGYSDEVISYGSSTAYSGDDKRQDMYDDIEHFVMELLLSKNAEAVNKTERRHYIDKMSNNIQRKFNARTASKKHINVIKTIENVISATKERKRYLEFDYDTRKEVANICSLQLRSTIPICNRHLNMNIRRNDMRVVVFGLMFLMRTGICIHDIRVLPNLPDLVQFLPNESNMLKFFEFKSKNITDIENKFKFHLRYVTRSKMHEMGFHLTRGRT